MGLPFLVPLARLSWLGAMVPGTGDAEMTNFLWDTWVLKSVLIGPGSVLGWLP